MLDSWNNSTPQQTPKRHPLTVLLWKFDTRVDVQNTGVVQELNPRFVREAGPLPLRRSSHNTSAALMSGKLMPADC